MSTSSTYRMAWTAREVAFIIGFADYCIHHDWKYQDRVAPELQKFSTRKADYKTVKNKLSRVFKNYGITNVSLPEFRAQGTGRIDLTLIPADIRAELDGWREKWGFPPLGANAALPDKPSSDRPADVPGPDEDVVSAIPGSLCKS